LGVVICIAGNARSMLTVAVAVLLGFPATSVQLPEAACPAPSDATLTGALQVAMPDPDSASVPLTVTVTGVLFQPLALGAGLAVAVATGAVVSMLMPIALAEPLLPARSTQLPVAD
jgi:hypothetical protein